MPDINETRPFSFPNSWYGKLVKLINTCYPVCLQVVGFEGPFWFEVILYEMDFHNEALYFKKFETYLVSEKLNVFGVHLLLDKVPTY
jgi:hypothetical protein